MRPPRADHIGEQVYAEHWQRFMRGEWRNDMHPLSRVLGGDVRHGLRRSRVASTFILWLGTNCGQCLIFDAKRLAKQGVRHPFLVAWTLENLRQPGINGGLRLIEHMLARDCDYGGRWEASTGHGLIRVPAYSTDDLATLERLTIWLGEAEGQGFIHEAEREIRHRQSERGQREMAALSNIEGAST